MKEPLNLHEGKDYVKKNDERFSISVITLNFNSRIFLENCLRSVLNTDYRNFEVIFVDNASTDGSVKLVKNLFGEDPRLKIIINPKNLGFSEGNNIGAKGSKGECIVFLNVDTEVDPSWLKELVKVMALDPKIGAAQSKLLLAQDRRRLESVGHFIDYCGVESLESARVTGQIDHGQYDRVRDIFYARGAAMIIRRRVLREIGLFDPAYFTDHEEIDLCWRTRLRGYKIVYVPKSIVYHARGGASWQARRKRPSWITFHLRKNHIASLIKNYEFQNLIKYLPRYLIYLILHAGYKMLKGDINISKVCYKAILWNLIKFKYVYSQRQKVQHRIRKVSDEHIMKYMTKPEIPWHFLQ